MRATRVIDGEGSYLVTWFRAFYNEVIRVKQLIEAGLPVTTQRVSAVRMEELAPAGDVPEASQEESLMLRADGLDDVLAVRRCLMTVLERQENAAERIGGEHSFKLYKLAQYVMAALADEVFLNLDWEGRLLWKDHLLEAKLFQTAAAGDRVFNLIDCLLQECDSDALRFLQEREPGTVDLAKVCLLALVLDFQGRYRYTGNLAPLAIKRNKLYAFIASQDATLNPDRPALFPQAYGSTLREGFAEMLPNPIRWIWVLVFVIVTMFVVSATLWNTLTSQLKHELNQIEVVIRADSLTNAMRFNRLAQPPTAPSDTTQAP